jgi:hypothetical protein
MFAESIRLSPPLYLFICYSMACLGLMTLFYSSVMLVRLEWNQVHYYRGHLLTFYTSPGLQMAITVQLVE